MDKQRSKKIWSCIILFLIGSIFVPWLVYALDLLMTGQVLHSESFDLSYFTALQVVRSKESCQMLFLCFEGILLLSIIYYIGNNCKTPRSELYRVTDTISIPVPCGEGQYGNAWFLEKKMYKKVYARHVINPRKRLIRRLIAEGIKDREKIDQNIVPSLKEIKPLRIKTEFFSRSGMVIGVEMKKGVEKVITVDHDSHLLCLGSTRIGKSRCMVVESIGILALSGESMFITDMKGELLDYMAPYLKRLGYKVYAIDFKEAQKSDKYNLLQPIIDAAKRGDMDEVEELTADFSNMIVQETSHATPIWRNGERAMVEMAILAVVIENIHQPENQTIYNAYKFIAEMGEMVTIPSKDPKKPIEKSKLDLFIQEIRWKNPHHKILNAYAAAVNAGKEAHETIASFITSAMTTLRIFALGKVDAMTNASDFSIKDLNDHKTAIFLILPDQKQTYYPIAAALIFSLYDGLIKIADRQGGRLKRRVRFVLDEFGNMVKINGFDTMLTAGGSRGILMALFIQSFAQLTHKYSREINTIVQDNCETLIYLHSDSDDTNEIISKSLSTYTCNVFNASASSRNQIGDFSSSSSKMTRRLLEKDEIKAIMPPYNLILGRNKPAVMYSPDLSKWHFNEMFGMGSEAHNTRLRYLRNQARPERDISKETHSWDIWDTYDNQQYATDINYYKHAIKNFDPIRFRTDEKYQKKVEHMSYDEQPVEKDTSLIDW